MEMKKTEKSEVTVPCLFVQREHSQLLVGDVRSEAQNETVKRKQMCIQKKKKRSQYFSNKIKLKLISLLFIFGFI